MKDLQQQFLSEAADLLEHVDAGLLELERNPHDRSLLDEIFRAAHTLKGSSGLFDLPQLTRLTHAAEDLLDAVRAGRLDLTGTMTDDLLAAFDLIRRWLDVVEQTGALPPTATAEGTALGTRLRSPLGQDPGPDRAPQPDAAAGTGAAVPAVAAAAPRWLLDGLGEARVAAVRTWLEHAVTTCRVVRFEPGEQCFFLGEDPVHLVGQIPAIEDLAIEPREPWPALESLDEYRCLLVFTVVTRASVAELEHLFRYVPDEVSVAEVDAAGLAELLAPAPAPHPGGGDAAATARQVLESQLRALRVELPPDQAAARIASAAAIARSALAALGRSGEQSGAWATAFDEAVREGAPAVLADLLERELAALAAAPDADEPGATPENPENPENPGVTPEKAGVAPAEAWVTPEEAWRRSGSPDRRTGPADRRAGSARVLKVDQTTVDRMFDLVGQLVVAKNGLPFLAEAAEEHWNARALGRQIKDQYGVVNRITEDLQNAVMEVRMMPMAVVFARFPRMIRDLARTLGKEVALELEGEDTAADKDVIEMLGDPLVHLVRNSLDHGVEPPGERLAAGKPAGATIRLHAVQEPDAVVIDVIDDGRGIDPEKIRRKAYERGLVSEEQLETLTDQDAVNLVFLPGFSTAEQVSDVSGRGVGMDAVRAAVEAVGGSVRLSSTPGQGSRVRLRMPLSMAVSQVMIVAVGGQRFGVPLDLVIETVRVPPEKVVLVEHQGVMVLRDTVIPLVDLAEALQMPGTTTDQERVSVLVTRPARDDVGLVVDAFHGGAEVIVRPMEGILAGSRQFCGTALMGDGSVLLVLDVAEVLGRAREAG